MASLYPFIKEDILKDIQSGVYQEDKMLPPEREFTEKYRVSRMTIRRALDELIQDGDKVQRWIANDAKKELEKLVKVQGRSRLISRHSLMGKEEH